MKPIGFEFFAFMWVVGLAWLLGGCSATPINMKCQEIRTRMELQNQSEDQKRFAEQELRDCELQLNEAQNKDSTALKNLENRFTPEDSL